MNQLLHLSEYLGQFSTTDSNHYKCQRQDIPKVYPNNDHYRTHHVPPASQTLDGQTTTMPSGVH